MKKPALLTWAQLKGQFGSEYRNSRDSMKDFKRKFKKSFAELNILYPQINYKFNEKGLTLKPSRLFIKRISE